MRTLAGIVGLLGGTVALWYSLRYFFANQESPRTMTAEYQQAMTEKALEENQNPITGIASEGYKGKGHAGNLH